MFTFMEHTMTIIYIPITNSWLPSFGLATIDHVWAVEVQSCLLSTVQLFPSFGKLVANDRASSSTSQHNHSVQLTSASACENAQVMVSNNSAFKVVVVSCSSESKFALSLRDHLFYSAGQSSRHQQRLIGSLYPSKTVHRSLRGLSRTSHPPSAGSRRVLLGFEMCTGSTWWQETQFCPENYGYKVVDVANGFPEPIVSCIWCEPIGHHLGLSGWELRMSWMMMASHDRERWRLQLSRSHSSAPTWLPDCWCGQRSTLTAKSCARCPSCTGAEGMTKIKARWQASSAMSATFWITLAPYSWPSTLTAGGTRLLTSAASWYVPGSAWTLDSLLWMQWPNGLFGVQRCFVVWLHLHPTPKLDWTDLYQTSLRMYMGPISFSANELTSECWLSFTIW